MTVIPMPHKLGGMIDERTLLFAHLDAQRAHVLATTDDLGDDHLLQPVAPSGWSIARMINHLTYDDEIFWGAAVLGGDEEAIGLVQDGWQVPVTRGADAIATYRRWTMRVDDLLADLDLDSAPKWWPGSDVFPFPAFETSREVVLRLLTETATHAGHLDLAREHIDGHQHLVVE